MRLKVLEPLADIQEQDKGKEIRPLNQLEGKRMGLLWSQHASSAKFWPVLEEVVKERLHPSEVHKYYKSSSWNTASPEELKNLVQKVDYMIVGVGG